MYKEWHASEELLRGLEDGTRCRVYGEDLLMTRDELAGMIDHTQLAADTAERDIDRLCEEAAEYGFACVSINPTWIVRCAERLAGTGVGANATIGFPLGANTTHVKAAEARDAVERGATEVDMVMNVGALKSGFVEQVESKTSPLWSKVPARRPVKVILETSLLDDVEKATACEIAVRAGAAFVKTATGFGPGGATAVTLRRVFGALGRASSR